MSEDSSVPYTYIAGGGVLVRGQRVLVVNRPSRGETRLPKGHVEVGEDPAQASLREVAEETGFEHVELGVDLSLWVLDPIIIWGSHRPKALRKNMAVVEEAISSPRPQDDRFE